jgi:hypothetical protein
MLMTASMRTASRGISSCWEADPSLVGVQGLTRYWNSWEKPDRRDTVDMSPIGEVTQWCGRPACSCCCSVPMAFLLPYLSGGGVVGDGGGGARCANRASYRSGRSSSTRPRASATTGLNSGSAPSQRASSSP